MKPPKNIYYVIVEQGAVVLYFSFVVGFRASKAQLCLGNMQRTQAQVKAGTCEHGCLAFFLIFSSVVSALTI